VSVDAKRAFSGKFRETKQNSAPTGTGYATNWQLYFRMIARKEVGIAREEIGGAFAQQNLDLRDIANEIVGDLAPHIKTIEATVDLRAYAWHLGEVVKFTYPRYGFAGGVNCRVIGIAPDFVKEQINVTLITKLDPDYTTASYN
jgi:hypothetical protein